LEGVHVMTEEIEAIAKRLVVGHKRDGRSIYDPKARGELVRVCRQPGVSLAKIARTCGINANVLSNWLRQHERGEVVAGVAQRDVIEMPAASTFVAVQLDATASPPPPRTVAPLNVQVRLPNGTTLDLRGSDLDGVLKLIDGLGRLRCSASTKP
jgi:transposase